MSTDKQQGAIRRFLLKAFLASVRVYFALWRLRSFFSPCDAGFSCPWTNDLLGSCFLLSDSAAHHKMISKPTILSAISLTVTMILQDTRISSLLTCGYWQLLNCQGNYRLEASGSKHPNHGPIRYLRGRLRKSLTVIIWYLERKPFRGRVSLITVD